MSSEVTFRSSCAVNPAAIDASLHLGTGVEPLIAQKNVTSDRARMDEVGGCPIGEERVSSVKVSDVLQGGSAFDRSWETKKAKNEKRGGSESDAKCHDTSITDLSALTVTTRLRRDDGGEHTYVLVNRYFGIPFNDPILLTLRQRVDSSLPNFGTELKLEPSGCSLEAPQRHPPRLRPQSPSSRKIS